MAAAASANAQHTGHIIAQVERRRGMVSGAGGGAPPEVDVAPLQPQEKPGPPLADSRHGDVRTCTCSARTERLAGAVVTARSSARPRRPPTVKGTR